MGARAPATLQAFDLLVAHFQDAVVGAAVCALGSFEDAQDIAQETFIQAWRDLPSLRDECCFPSWLLQIARHRCQDHLRRPQHRELPMADPVQEAAGSPGAPLRPAAPALLRDQVMEAISELSEPNRLATTLFYINGYSIAEVAGLLAVPPGTVKRRLHESRRRLQGSMMKMVRDTLGEGKPGEELRARVAAELQARLAQWEAWVSGWHERAPEEREQEESLWAQRWHELRMADVRANAAQYGVEPDESLPRMLPEYRQSNTFRDDMLDMPRRWGIPEGLELLCLRDVVRELTVSPLAVLRWEQAGMPVVRYHPWALYDLPRVRQWLDGVQPEPVQPITPEEARRPLLVAMRALADGLCPAEEAARVYDALETACFLDARDRVWAEDHKADLPAQLRANAALYGLSRPADSWLGIPSGAAVREIRDLTRCLTVSPIDVVRWTRAGMPCLRRGAMARWDLQHVTAWLSEQGILPAQCDLRELDQTERFVCSKVAGGQATADEGYEALSGWLGVM